MSAIAGPSIHRDQILELIYGIRIPTSGKIEFNDISYEELGSEFYQKNMFYFKQNPAILPGNIYDNFKLIRFGIQNEEVDFLLKEMKAYDYLSKLPQGLNTQLDLIKNQLPQEILIKIQLAFLEADGNPS